MNGINHIAAAIAREQAELVEVWARDALKEYCGFTDEELAQPIEMIAELLSKRGLRFTHDYPCNPAGERPFYTLHRDADLVAQFEIRHSYWPTE